MNMHLSPQDPELRAHLERDVAATPSAVAGPPRRRLWLIGLGLLGLVALGVWLLVQKATAPGPVQPPSGPPSVSVMVPGTVLVAERVSAVGSIAARRDMPVGVVGEGGMVTAIRAEAGQFVRAGQVLADIDTGVQRAQLAQLEAGVVQADADARLAQSELDRAQALVGRGFISKADIDRRTATRDSARARVGVARAQVREQQARIARLAIRAPESGLVLQRMVEPGQIVSSASGGLFRIAAGGQMEVRAQVAEQDMQRLRTGQAASVVPVGSSRSYAGTLWLLEPVIDPQSRLGVARVALPASPDLRAGGFANVEIAGASAMRPVLPQSAVQATDGGSYVFVVGNDDRVSRRAVTVGTISERGLAITSGLTGAERVVVAAAPFLREGEQVKPVRETRRAAPAPAAGAAG